MKTRLYQGSSDENVSQDEVEVRSKQSVQHLQDEIEVQTLRAGNFKKRFEDIHEKAEQYLQSQTTSLEVKRRLITLWNNDCKREAGITHGFWKEKEVFFRSEFEKETVGETNHTLLIINKENHKNSEKNVTTRINTSQPGEKQAPLPEQGLQCNQGMQYEGSVGQNFTQAQNPNFARQFNDSYFVKPRGPYRPKVHISNFGGWQGRRASHHSPYHPLDFQAKV